MSARTIVIDNGSGYIKAGFASDSTPRVIVPSYWSHNAPQPVGSTEPPYFFGDDAIARSGQFKLYRPMNYSSIESWFYMTELWRYTSAKLGVNPAEYSVIITQGPEYIQTPRAAERQKIINVMLTEFKVQSAYVVNSSVAALYGADRRSGLVLDSGHQLTIANNNYLANLLNIWSPSWPTERLKAPESLFYMDKINGNGGSIATMVFHSIIYGDVKHRPVLFENIVLAGGSTIFPGLAERLTADINTLSLPGTKIKVIALPTRKHLVWMAE
ncbi:actin family [Syncephalis fuscata]|nr:actin family [Syncephalis fuscata]